jgi:acetyl-CoA synthetase
VAAAAAIGVPDTLRGQVVKAFIVARPGHATDTAAVADIQGFVRSRLSQHEYPRQIAFVADLPRTPAGKINRKVLRDQEFAGAPATHHQTEQA